MSSDAETRQAGWGGGPTAGPAVGLPATDLQGVTAPALRLMVARAYISLLRRLEGRIDEELESCAAGDVNGLLREFEAAVAPLAGVLREQVSGRLAEVVQREVQALFRRAAAGDGAPRHEAERGEAGAPRPPGAGPQDPRPIHLYAPPHPDGTTAANGHPRGAGPYLDHHQATPASPPVDGATALAVAEAEPAFLEAAAPAQGPQAAASPDAASEALYEGTVRLEVDAVGCSRQVVQLLSQLGRSPQFRVLQLVGSRRERVSVWLGLREPVALLQALTEMEGVAEVSPQPGRGGSQEVPRLTVRLG